MNNTSTYTKIMDNLKFLKSKDSINVIDDSDRVNVACVHAARVPDTEQLYRTV